MQKRIFSLLLILILLMVVFPSCGKYEDGPTFSLASKTSRVANTWKIEKVFVDDVDRTSIYEEYINSYKLELAKDGKLSETYTTTLGTENNEGTWAFENSSENIAFTILEVKTTNKILRLKSSEMWLKETKDGKIFVKHYASY